MLGKYVLQFFILCTFAYFAQAQGPGLTTPTPFMRSTSTLLALTRDVEECSDPHHKAGFSLLDYAVLLSMLFISLSIGIYYGFFKESEAGFSSNYLLGSEMGLTSVTLSLTTSFLTAIELLGNPAELYFQGTQYVLIVIPMVLVLPVAIWIFYPMYFRMKLTSCYAYLGIRFGKEIRVLGALLYIIQMCLYTSVAVLAPSIALAKATGLDMKIAVVLIYVVCILYSTQGGIKAIVIVDTFQATVLLGSLCLIAILGCWYSGSPSEIFSTAEQYGRIEKLNFDVDPTTRHTVWSIVIGGFFYWTSLFCTNQASVQKCMTLRTQWRANLALTLAIIGLIVLYMINFYTGLMVFHHYAGCDPLSAGLINAKDQLLSYYVISTYEHVYTVAGVFVAGIFAASLGTVATALNSLSAVTCEDLLINGLNMPLTPERCACYAKRLSIAFGLLSFGLVFVVERLGGILQVTLTLTGITGGVILGLFVLGIISKTANSKGALYGGLMALKIVFSIGTVAQFANEEPVSLPLSVQNCTCHVTNATAMPDAKRSDFTQWPIFKLSYMWYSMIGCLLTVFLGFVFSVLINALNTNKTMPESTPDAEPDQDADFEMATRSKSVPKRGKHATKF